MLTIAVLLISTSAYGGTLHKHEISRDANWVIHADYEGFNASTMGKLIRADLAVQGIEEKLKSFATVFSFHPIDDIRDVTIYGCGEDRGKAVALIDGQFDQDKLIALVRMNAKHQEIPYGDVTLHRWLHEDKKKHRVETQMLYGCILEGRFVAISAGLDALKQAVEVLKGSAENAAGLSSKLEAQVDSGVFFQALATDVGETVSHKPGAVMLRQTDDLGLVIGEQQNKAYCSVGLSANTAEAAQHVKQMLEGIIALAALAGEDQPGLTELAKHLHLSCEDKTVHLRFEADSKALLDFFKAQHGNKQKQQCKGS